MAKLIISGEEFEFSTIAGLKIQLRNSKEEAFAKISDINTVFDDMELIKNMGIELTPLSLYELTTFRHKWEVLTNNDD